MFDKTYELPLSRDYVRHWGVPEAVRELLQNALDSDSPLEWNFGPGSLRITSRHARLEPKTLLLGTTSKSEDSDKIGQFGEGYKIAMLVLTRCDVGLQIQNNDLLWEPVFEHSRMFESEVLKVRETKFPEGRGKGLSFLLKNLAQQEIDQIKASTLCMQQSIGEVHDTSKGQILLDASQAGRLYVKGLFVCEVEMQYGYNIKPEFLQLERDRQTVSTFDLAFLTKEMWFEIGKPEVVAQLLSEKIPDLRYADYSTPAVVKEACYQHFRSKYPEAIIAESQEKLRELIEKGMTDVVYIEGAYGDIIRSSPSYTYVDSTKSHTPTEKLEEFFKEHRGDMRTKAIVAFKSLITQSQKWKGRQ